jgi:hypothetical protein
MSRVAGKAPKSADYPGVTWEKARKCWVARLAAKRPSGGWTMLSLGRFKSQADAGKAYVEARSLYEDLKKKQPGLSLGEIRKQLIAVVATCDKHQRRPKWSEYEGVTWDKKWKVWKARLYTRQNGEGKICHIGNFRDELSAAYAHKMAKLLLAQINDLTFPR